MRVEIFDQREKIQPVPLDGVKRHTSLQGAGKLLVPLPHGECGVRGRAPDPGQASHAWALPGGNPGWGEHWERSDLCEGKSPLGVEGT